MKSIIQEASTVAKAIEKAWQKAGKPKAFSVKIFEEAERNFFGMTTRQAKVGIFTQERSPRRDQRPKRHTPDRRKSHRRSDDQWHRPQEHARDGEAEGRRTQEITRKRREPSPFGQEEPERSTHAEQDQDGERKKHSHSLERKPRHGGQRQQKYQDREQDSKFPHYEDSDDKKYDE